MDPRAWFERVQNVVETSGTYASSIQLLANGQMWHCWERPFSDDWAHEAEDILRDLAEQWPAKKWPVQFQAESRSGQIVSVCPLEVMGRSKARDSMMGTPDGTLFKAASDAMDALQRTWEKSLQTCNAQLDVSQRQTEQYGRQVMGLLEYVRAGEEYRALEAKRMAELTQNDPLKEQFAEALPGLVQMFGDYLNTKAKAAAAGINPNTATRQAVNGVASDLAKTALRALTEEKPS